MTGVRVLGGWTGPWLARAGTEIDRPANPSDILPFSYSVRRRYYWIGALVLVSPIRAPGAQRHSPVEERRA